MAAKKWHKSISPIVGVCFYSFLCKVILAWSLTAGLLLGPLLVLSRSGATMLTRLLQTRLPFGLKWGIRQCGCRPSARSVSRPTVFLLAFRNPLVVTPIGYLKRSCPGWTSNCTPFEMQCPLSLTLNGRQRNKWVICMELSFLF